MAAHRYWRLGCTNNATAGTDVYSTAELSLATAVGGATVTTGGTASASSTNGGLVAANAFDGSGSTMWASFPPGGFHWLQYDFGAGNSKDIVEFGILARSDGFAYQVPTWGSLQYSDDAITWTDLITYREPTWNTAEWRYFSTAALTASRFDYLYKTSTVRQLTSSRLVSTFTAVGTAGINNIASGPVYSEFTITTLTGTPAVGVINGAYNYAVGTLLGADANSLGYRSTGAVVANGVTLATIATFVQGDRVDVAFDPDSRLIWFRVNGGSWNNSGTADPASLAGGIDTSSVNFGRALLAAGASITGTVITGAFDTFVGTAPTGFLSPSTRSSTPSAPRPSTIVLPGYVPYQGPLAYKGGAYNAYNLFYPAGPMTYVSGVLKELGVPAAGRKVEVFDRITGALIGSTTSAGDGSWSVACAGRTTVRIVASDPTAYNSLALDNVSPA